MKHILLFFIITATMFSCKKEGCTDSKAQNFDAEAKKDDGSCSYKLGCTDPLADNYDETAYTDDGTCLYDNKGFLKINFRAKYNGNDLVKNANYTNVDNVEIDFSMLKSYFSTLKVSNSSGIETELKDVLFVDFFKTSDLTYVFALPEASYNSISFITGLTPTQNATDPTTVDADNPLSVYFNMYWNWATRYIFYKVEGTYDSDGDPSTLESSFIYHIGSDPLSDTITFSKSFSIVKKDTIELDVFLNMDQFFYNTSDTIHVLTESNTQTVDNLPLAERVSKLFSLAFSTP